MNGNFLSLGRNHTTADTACVVHLPACPQFDCPEEFRVELRWSDGGYVYCVYDTRAEADQHLNSLGFYPTV